jgi:hypothetical protein
VLRRGSGPDNHIGERTKRERKKTRNKEKKKERTKEREIIEMNENN